MNNKVRADIPMSDEVRAGVPMSDIERIFNLCYRIIETQVTFNTSENGYHLMALEAIELNKKSANGIIDILREFKDKCFISE